MVDSCDARALAFELAEQVRVFAMRALDAALRRVALALRRRRAARGTSARCASQSRACLFAARELGAQCLRRCSRSSTPACGSPPRLTRSQSRPIQSPVARDDRLVGASARRSASASASVSASDARATAAHDGRGPLHAGQHAGVAVGLRRARRPAAATRADRQRREHVGDLVERVDAHRFEVIAQHGFHGALPARRPPSSCCGEPRLLAEARAREPLGGACSPRPSAAFCSASSDTTSARRRSRSVRAVSDRLSASSCAARSFCERSSACAQRARSSSALLRAHDPSRSSCAEQRRRSAPSSASRSTASRSGCAASRRS